MMKDIESLTGVSRETIRFYIREGLLPEPAKPKRNVAYYSAEHVEKVQLIKSLQRHFLPLKVVKSVLASPGSSIYEMSQFLPALLTDFPAEETTDCLTTLTVAVKQSGLSAEEIQQLVSLGAVSLHDGQLSPRDTAIVNAWGEARKMGFTPVKGYDEEFFASLLAAVKPSVDFEVEHFFNAFEDELDGESAAALGAQGIGLMNRLLALLHTRYVLMAVQHRSTAVALKTDRKRSQPQTK